MTDWMKLLGFDKQKHLQVGYMLPIHHAGLIRKLSWLEKGMKSWLPFSSALNDANSSSLGCKKTIAG
jgi:hypothetical protein